MLLRWCVSSSGSGTMSLCVTDNQEAEPEEVWPPAGFSTYYEVMERLDRRSDLSYDLVLPGTFSKVDLSTQRIGRHGGANEEDLQFRTELYARVGAIAVAGGHVETAMKRLLLVLTAPDEARFSTVDKTWTRLHADLRAQCDGTDERRQRLADALDWAEANRIKDRRDDVIHAYWWTFAGCGARRSRFNRGGDGKTILAELADLDEDSRLLFEYADRLDLLLANDWVIARLPGPFILRPGTSVVTPPHPSS